MSVFDDAILDINPAVEGGCVVDPVTRDVSGTVGQMVSDDSTLPVGKVLDIDDAVSVVSGIGIDFAAADISVGDGSYSISDDGLIWVRDGDDDVLTVSATVDSSDPDLTYFSMWIDCLDGGSYSVDVSCFDDSDSLIKSFSGLCGGNPEGWWVVVAPLSGSGVVDHVEVSVSRGNSSTVFAGSEVRVRMMGFGDLSAGDWHPAFSGRDDLIVPTAVSDFGPGLRFDGGETGGWGLVDTTGFTDQSCFYARCSNGAVSSGYREYDRSDAGDFIDPPNFTGTGEFTVAPGSVYSRSFVVVHCEPGGFVELFHTRTDGALGVEWSGAEGSSSLVPNVVDGDFLYTGASLTFSRGGAAPGTYVALVEDCGISSWPFLGYSWVASESLGNAFARWVSGWSLGGDVEAWDFFPGSVAARYSSGSQAQVDVLPAGSFVSNFGPPDLTISSGLKVSRILAWDRVLSDEELSQVLVRATREISWDVPLDGGSPITGFRVFTVRGGEVSVENLPADATSYSTGSYGGPVWVSAVNAVGVGTPGGAA